MGTQWAGGALGSVPLALCLQNKKDGVAGRGLRLGPTPTWSTDMSPGNCTRHLIAGEWPTSSVTHTYPLLTEVTETM